MRTIKTTLAAVLILALTPILVLARLVMGPFEKPALRSAADVAETLRGFIDGTGEPWDWDDFEAISLADPELERLRVRAVRAGPPDADIAELKAVLAEVERLDPRAGSPATG